MITMHEDEYYKSLVDDETLRIVLLFCGQEAKDKLLIKKEDALCSISSNSYTSSVTSR